MGTLGKTWSEAQCGTEGGHRQHYRRGERSCYSCMQAHDRYRAERRGCQSIGPGIPDPRPVRNGLPVKLYVYRGTGADAFTGEVVQ
jgi:hypothetical protein